MLSIQETVQKDQVKEQLRLVRSKMDAYGSFHPEQASIYNVESEALRLELQDTLKRIPLREFLAKSGTTGIAGAAYLIPDKIHDDLIMYSRQTDAVPSISAQIVSGWAGGDLLVDIADDGTWVAQEFTSGGQIPTGTVNSVQATLAPISFAIAPRITDDLLEDAVKFGGDNLVDYHLRHAALALGDKATSLALTVLAAPPDGWGTAHATASGDADETKLTLGTTTDVVLALRKLGDDRWIGDTMVTTPESWGHSISMQAVGTGWGTLPPTEGYTNRIGQLDVLQLTNAELHDSADLPEAAFTACLTLVFSRANAMLTGRKRWMQINNYSEPVKGLAGAVISCRQDSVTLYKDAVYKITET